MNSVNEIQNQVQEERPDAFSEIKKRDFSKEAEIFKALGHPIRLKIVYGLLKVGGCNVKTCRNAWGCIKLRSHST